MSSTIAATMLFAILTTTYKCATAHSNDARRAIRSETETDSQLHMRSITHALNRLRTPAITHKKENDGYIFDACRTDGDCRGARYCTTTDDVEQPCTEDKHCFCFRARMKLCTTCKDCRSYPRETCTRAPDVRLKNGLCTSSFMVFDGVLTEVGCNTYPDAVLRRKPGGGKDDESKKKKKKNGKNGKNGKGKGKGTKRSLIAEEEQAYLDSKKEDEKNE